MLFFKKIRRFFQPTVKTEGATLITVMILSALVIALSIGLVHVVEKELQLSSDILFGEKAYFAAESGVEHALFVLNQTPVYHGKNTLTLDPAPAKTHAKININNQGTASTFTLPSYGAKKFRLKTAANRPVNLQKLTVSTTPPRPYLWGIQCQKTPTDGSPSSLVSIQSQRLNSFNFRSFFRRSKKHNLWEWSGNNDDESLPKTFDALGREQQTTTTVAKFWRNLLPADQKTCFLSFQNNTETPLKFELAGPLMPPAKARVTAIGQARNRQKTIQFDYLQDNLSAFFNFGLLHQDRE